MAWDPGVSWPRLLVTMAAGAFLVLAPTTGTVGAAEGDPLEETGLEASGILAGEEARPVHLEVGPRGAEDCGSPSAPARLEVVDDPSQDQATEDEFCASWTKAAGLGDPLGATPWWMGWSLLLEADTTWGSLALTGLWTPASVPTFCTSDFYASSCNHWGAGPVVLDGTLGGGDVALAGEAKDTFCTQDAYQLVPGYTHVDREAC